VEKQYKQLYPQLEYWSKVIGIEQSINSQLRLGLAYFPGRKVNIKLTVL